VFSAQELLPVGKDLDVDEPIWPPENLASVSHRGLTEAIGAGVEPSPTMIVDAAVL
jgi:hypothetical protein